MISRDELARRYRSRRSVPAAPATDHGHVLFVDGGWMDGQIVLPRERWASLEAGDASSIHWCGVRCAAVFVCSDGMA
jgi:hypothetical protein